MKNFIKQWIYLFGLVIVSVAFVPAFVNHEYSFLKTILGILMASLLICIANKGIEVIDFSNMILSHVVRFVMILVIVYVMGWIFQWYQPQYWWTMTAMVLPVYCVYYAIDCIQVNREIKSMNQQIDLTHFQGGRKDDKEA